MQRNLSKLAELTKSNYYAVDALQSTLELFKYAKWPQYKIHKGQQVPQHNLNLFKVISP